MLRERQEKKDKEEAIKNQKVKKPNRVDQDKKIEINESNSKSGMVLSDVEGKTNKKPLFHGN